MFQTIEEADVTRPQYYLDSLLRRIVAECPRRAPASADERRAQEILAAEFRSVGLATKFIPFRFNNSLYATIALHFAVAILGTVCLLVHPLLAAALHTLAGVSYILDSTHRGYWLRRLFRFQDSQNLVSTAPAKLPLRRRLVFLSHADAASTGLLFTPWLVRLTAKYRYIKPFRLLRKQMLLAVGGFFGLALFETLNWCFGWSLGSYRLATLVVGWTAWVWTIAMLLNLEVALRWRVVPGANDNLTGCVALPVLARRLLADKPDDVEFAFVVTGCEEAGAGGANALAAEMLADWDRRNTTIVNLDTISGGKLRSYREGEFWPLPTATWLREILDEVAQRDERFDGMLPYDAPAGMTDYAPFQARGYDGVTLCRIDPSLGVPKNYHRLSDTIDNLDLDAVAVAIDAAEQVAREIMREANGSPIAEPSSNSASE